MLKILHLGEGLDKSISKKLMGISGIMILWKGFFIIKKRGNLHHKEYKIY